jgi:hypothetical protein
MAVPSGVTAVSVKAVLTVLRDAGVPLPPPSPTVIAVSTGVPTTKPAAVIAVLAAESAVPCCYSRLSVFSILLFTSIFGHIMLPYLLKQPMYQLHV